MDADLYQRLKYELNILLDDREKYQRRLDAISDYEDVLLAESRKPGGKRYYYAKRKGSAKYKYVGKRNEPIVVNTRDAHFLRETIKTIESDIRLITPLLDKYLQYDQNSVNDRLPKVYKGDIVPASRAYERAAAKWRADRLAFQARFPENYPEHKREHTSDGVMVKTISEVVLYERIKSAGLCGIYELPLVLGDYRAAMYPDLTVLSPIDLKSEIIIEYVGRLDLPQYRNEFVRKIERYISNGYVPGVDLHFVFGDKDGHIDSMQINRIIADIRGI